MKILSLIPIGLFAVILSFAQQSHAQNTIPSGCIAAPLPTTPTGPTWRGEYNTGNAASPRIARVTIWRKPCTNTTAVTLATFEQVSGAASDICNLDAAAVQNNVQFNSLSYLINPALTTNFCADLLATSTFILRDSNNASNFNPSNAFTFIPETSPSGSVATLRLDVGAFNAADYGNTAPLQITGKQSGTWFNQSRSGEGFMFEIGVTGSERTIIATWFTYRNGQQAWIAGNAPLPLGTTSIQIPMFVTRGPQFGAAFNSADVISEAWGTVTLTFPGCNAATINYAPLVGAGGTIQAIRLKTQIDGLGCP